MKILYIEDDAHVRGAVIRMLRRWYVLGAEDLRIAESADEAIEHVKTSVFDVVLSDYNLIGGQTGGQVLRWIKAHTPYLAPRFLFLSGNTDCKIFHAHWLDKPCQPALLRETIDCIVAAV